MSLTSKTNQQKHDWGCALLHLEPHTVVWYANARIAPDNPALLLSVREKADADGNSQRTSLVHESVYSRNRCFRLLYQSKFGKRAALRIADSGAVVKSTAPAPVQLLQSMASFVLADTEIFEHSLFPPDYCHTALKVSSACHHSVHDSRKGTGDQADPQ